MSHRDIFKINMYMATVKEAKNRKQTKNSYTKKNLVQTWSA